MFGDNRTPVRVFALLLLECRLRRLALTRFASWYITTYSGKNVTYT